MSYANVFLNVLVICVFYVHCVSENGSL